MADVGIALRFGDDPVVGQFLDLFEGVGKIVGQQYTITL